MSNNNAIDVPLPVAGTYGGTGVNNGASTITIGGNIAFSGAFTFTGTITGNTTVTFPTSGTLATTAGTVASITGTASQIAASASTGAVTLSIPSNPILPGIPSFTTFAPNVTSTASTGGTIAMSNTSTYWQTLTGVLTETYTLPDATTLPKGTSFFFNNNSTGALTVNDNGSTLVVTIPAGGAALIINKNIGSPAGQWDAHQLLPTNGIVPLAQGGTNANLTASNGGVFYSTASAGAILAGTATANQLLLSGATAAPTWSTTTYPATNAINTLLYASSANVMGALATANGGSLITSSTGVPSILQLGQFQHVVGVASNGTPVVSTVPGRNMLINGDMQVWQRGAGGSAAIAVAASASPLPYTADRWQFSNGANQASTITQSAGVTSGSFFAKVQRNNAQTGTGALLFCQSLSRDMALGAAGNIVTLSFKAYAGANFSPTSGNITVTVYSGTGTTDISGINGAFTGSSSAISQTVAITATTAATAQNIIFSSSALGSAVTQLAVQFSWTPTGTAGADDSLYITDVQLEISSNQNAFDRRDFGYNYQRCQRYYWKTFPYGTAPATASAVYSGALAYSVNLNASTSTVIGSTPYYSVLMVQTPTLTFYNPTSANAKWYNQTLGADSGAVTAINSHRGGFTAENTQLVGDLSAAKIYVHATADAELY